MSQSRPSYATAFRDIDLDALPQVGGKNASLGEMIGALSERGVRVPDGFAVTADAFRLHLRQAGLEESIYGELEGLDVADVEALRTAGHRAGRLGGPAASGRIAL